MRLQMFTLTILTVTSESSHQTKNNTDVIVTYSGHAEAIEPPKVKKTGTEYPTTVLKILIPESYATMTTLPEEKTEGVVFVPHVKEERGNRGYNDRTSREDRGNREDRSRDDRGNREDRVRINDYMERDYEEKKTISDVINSKRVEEEPESPSEDILFISGKNTENMERPRKVETAPQPNYEIRRNEREKKPKQISLDCSHLDCNNTLNSVCGGKVEGRQWRYRIFLNECYFRKVNCGFKYEINRYTVVPDKFCKTVGSHNSERPMVYNPPPPMLTREVQPSPEPVSNLRRSFPSRRSLNMDLDGSFCSHACPATCPEDYSPECAITSNGEKKVFVNHCKLDYNSCSSGAVWHRRPLSECIGTKKADFRQNRGFISWMQHVGIVDGKGRLVMN